jgi:hypothetical protein
MHLHLDLHPLSSWVRVQVARLRLNLAQAHPSRLRASFKVRVDLSLWRVRWGVQEAEHPSSHSKARAKVAHSLSHRPDSISLSKDPVPD